HTLLYTALIYDFSRPPHSLISSLFLLMLPPPPRSTLFPYTTLFRSKDKLYLVLESTLKEKILKASHDTPLAGHQLFFKTYRQVRDRKSTRLNSSHVSISYAVFCLKKKNNKK